ncbi:penicillin-binding protein activator [Escherichia coli]|uniref:penicillin-binding protein activator n=1 Tax=Escherichia coli TaxID=562 RepID=UPI0011197038|nr:penicillin-binding protein activator [Escherichia coli]
MVPSTFSRLKAARCLPVVLAALIFAGCGTHTPDQSTAYMQGTAQADSAFYLQQMQQSSDDTRINWQLLAIRALVKEGKTGQAVELVNQLPQELNDNQRREKTLLAAEIKLAQKDFAGAQNLLAKITPADLEQNQQARYWQAKIDASQGRPSIDLLRALIAQEPLLGAKEKQQNIDATWQALSSMTQEQANTLVINADENILQGWLDLQRVWFDNRNDPDMMKAGIADWQKRYPNNPGAKMLPTQLVNVKAFKPASTNKIALLLPLNGQAAVFGRTIQQGFEAAKNIGTQPVAAQPVPVSAPATSTAAVNAPANPSAELKIYDTSSQPLSQILSQVQQDGASIVVGPLLKNNVEELLKSNTPLNVLALNQPENIENRVNICYFALSPEDEARDAARHIRDQGKQAPLVLIPRSSLGDRVANAFAQEWQKLGGGTVLQQKFGSTSELRAGVNGGSGIALTGSPITPRATTDSGMTTNNPTLQTTPTDDQFTNNGGRVDAVYIVATPGEIAFIKPMIAMRNGSQSGATLYASSRSAQGTAGPDFRLEMEGLQYSEIPMLAGGNLPLMQQALSAVNNDYSLARMYAMGVDAWSLANHFSQMRQVQGFEINGNTGSLTASPDCVINRKLSWLQYQQGQVVPAS